MQKESNFKKYFPLILLALGIISFSMIFFEAFFTAYDNFLVEIYPQKIASYTGWQIALGYTKEDTRILPFNTLATFAYLFPLLGGIFAGVRIEGFEIVKYFCSGILFIIAGVLLFLLPSFVQIPITIVQIVEYSSAPLIGGILAIVAGFGSFYYTIKI